MKLNENEKEILRRAMYGIFMPDEGVDEYGVVYLIRRDGETDDMFRERFLKHAKKQLDTDGN